MTTLGGSARCQDCTDWVFPYMGDLPPDEAQIVVSAAQLMHAFLAHPDKVHERTGLKLDLIAVAADAATKGIADSDPELAGLTGTDFDLIGRLWAHVDDLPAREGYVRAMTPAGRVILKELMREGKEWAARQRTDHGS